MRITEATLAAPHALGPGDRIVAARRDGTRAKFTVPRVERYPKAHSPTARVHGPTRRAALRLITCESPFYGATGHYVDQRRRRRRADSELASLRAQAS